MTVAHGTMVGRLRIRANSPDPTAWRVRGAAALGALDLQPASMPRQAILCIRTMRDPLPGGVDLRSSHAPRPEIWERAARAEITSMMQRAVRPALTPVPPTAEAVLFADPSELLACAARSAAQGVIGSQWWWEHLVVPRTAAGVAKEWLRTPEYVPAAIELLTQEQSLIAIERVMTAAEAVRVVEAVLRAQRLESVATAVVEALESVVPWSRFDAAIRSGMPVPAAWRDIAIEPQLQPVAVQHRVLAAMALVIRRRQAVTRSSRFAQEAVSWITAMRVEERKRESVAAPPLPSAASAQQTDELTKRPPASEAVGQGTAPVKNDRPLATMQQPADTTHQPRASSTSELPATNAQPRMDVPGEAEGPASPEIPLADAPGSTDPAPPIVEAPATRTEREVVPRLVPDLIIQSEYGGLFFLLNVFVAMGLYSDFTSAVQQGLEYNLWHFLRLVGRALAGEELEDDPLWPFLEALAGDDHTAIDEETLSALVEQVREQLSIFETPDFLVKRFARITTSPAHLDVHFSLPAHPIEIRMAGLDRDPGWMPAAARHVAFHFD